MSNQRLDTLNKAYYYGEYDLKEYRELRSKFIDEHTIAVDSPATQKLSAVKTQPTLKINPQTVSESVAPADEKAQRGPSAMQFLWVSIAVILFIYMYTATIE